MSPEDGTRRTMPRKIPAHNSMAGTTKETHAGQRAFKLKTCGFGGRATGIPTIQDELRKNGSDSETN